MRQIVLAFILVPLLVAAQGVGINNPTPHSSALLDLTSTAKGMLVPRMTTAQRDLIPGPATSLLIFNTTNARFEYFDGLAWVPLLPGWGLAGNAGTNPATNFLGTTDNVRLNFRVNNQQAGRVDHLAFNTFFGYQAASASNPGTQNTAIGHQALFSNDGGSDNTAVGYLSLRANTLGLANASFGGSSLFSNTTGTFNSAFGKDALHECTTATGNTAMGSAGLFSTTTGNHNTAMGYQALQSNTTGDGNTALGVNAGGASFTGTNNTFIGYLSNANAINLNNATAIGARARVDLSNSVVIGSVNGINGAVATANVGIGTTAPTERLEIAGKALLRNGFSADNAALLYRTSTDYLFLGPQSGSAAGGGTIALYGSTNAVGANAGGIDLNTLGGSLRVLSNGNVGIGAAAPAERLHVVGKIRMADGTQATGRILTSDANGSASWVVPSVVTNAWNLNGNANTFGVQFLGTTDGWPLNFKVNNQRAGQVDQLLGSTFFGYQAGNANAAVENTAIGYQALTANNAGFMNTAIGTRALLAMDNGNLNTAVGTEALVNSTSASSNCGIGAGALRFNSTGNANTAVGLNALSSNTTTDFNTGLGFGVDVDATNRTNTVVIGGNGNLALGGSNRVRIGNNAMTSIGGQVGWTAISDERTKSNVREDVAGLAFIMRLRPVTYQYSIAKSNRVQGKVDTTDWAGKHDIERMRFSGFLAQQVQRAAVETGYDFSGVDKPQDGDGLWGLRYAEFTVPLVKAVQEMNGTVQEQQALIAQLRAEMETMREEMRQLRDGR